MDIKEILNYFEHLTDRKSIEGMKRVGIEFDKSFGVKLPEIRKLGKEIGKDSELAKELWEKKFRETMILASIIYNPEDADETLLERWVLDFDNWEICDQTIMNLFEKTRFAYDKALEWTKRDEEFVKRAGFVLMARLAVSDKKADDERFISFFPYLKEHSIDERNNVKKAISWAIRQIGKRNRNLHPKAIKLAEEVGELSSKAAKWIAADVLRELKSEKVIKRLK